MTFSFARTAHPPSSSWRKSVVALFNARTSSTWPLSVAYRGIRFKFLSACRGCRISAASAENLDLPQKHHGCRNADVERQDPLHKLTSAQLPNPTFLCASFDLMLEIYRSI